MSTGPSSIFSVVILSKPTSRSEGPERAAHVARSLRHNIARSARFLVELRSYQYDFWGTALKQSEQSRGQVGGGISRAAEPALETLISLCNSLLLRTF